MSAWREQALIHAPIEAVWRVVGDPARYPEWAGDVIDVTGLAEVEQGATFRQQSRVPFGKVSTNFEIESLEDLHEIRLRCMESGYYARWLLTEAGEDTFAEVEIGMHPESTREKLASAVFTKRWFRRVVRDSLNGLRGVVGAGPRPR